MAISNDILNRETDARFAAQSGHKPGVKLDPNNPTDKAMEPVWNDIYRKVKAEADAGTLVTTFDHPVVAQDLSDAAVAHRVAGVHADMAAVSPDPTTAAAHVAAATTAHHISKRKAREAASKQPPTVDPQLVKDASKEVASNPPPANAPASEHIAHHHVHHGAHAHAHGVHVDAHAAKVSRDALYGEVNKRFWRSTHYKENQKLDMSIPKDVEMAEIWRQILEQVQSEAAAGTLVLTSPDGTLVAPPILPLPDAGPPASIEPPPMAPSQPQVPPPQMAPPMPPMPPMPPQMPQMPMRPPQLPMRPPQLRPWPGMRPPVYPMPPRMPLPGTFHPMPGMGMPPMGMPPQQAPGTSPGTPGGQPSGSDQRGARGGHPHHHHRQHQRGEGPQSGTPQPGGALSPDGSPTGVSPPDGQPSSTTGTAPPGTSDVAAPPADSGASPGADAPSSGIGGGTIALVVLGVGVVGLLIRAHKTGTKALEGGGSASKLPSSGDALAFSLPPAARRSRAMARV